MRLLPLLVLLAAACARSNESLVAELERRARAHPDTAADALLDEDRRSVRLETPAREFELALLDARLPAVLGRINGIPMKLILDTGASLVSLSGPAAERTGLYLPPRPEARALSPGFDARYRLGVFHRLRLGPALFLRGIASVPLRESVGGTYAIVGCSVLAHYRITFDFRRRRVRFTPAREHGEPFFAAVLIGKRKYWLLVDSGATRVLLEPWAALELGLIDRTEAARHDAKSESFRSGRSTRIRLPEVTVAGKTFRDVPGGVVHTFPTGEGRPAGLLGLQAFGELAWTLDFTAKTIRLEE